MSLSPEPLTEDHVAAYVRRIDFQGDLAPNENTLRTLHRAHALAVPFENLDILLGRPILLDLTSLYHKFVDRRRGGYCFEQNTFFAAVLEHMGYKVTPLAARVRFGAQRILPRTHMLLQVDCEGSRFLADVGFGNMGPLEPVLMEPERISEQGAWRYRLVKQDALWILQIEEENAWSDLYGFTFEPQILVDYELANYYVSTHPASIFRQRLVAHKRGMQSRSMVVNLELIEKEGRRSTSVPIADDDELLKILDNLFGLSFPPETRFQFDRTAPPFKE